MNYRGPRGQKLLRISENLKLPGFELSEVNDSKNVGQNRGKRKILRIIQVRIIGVQPYRDLHPNLCFADPKQHGFQVPRVAWSRTEIHLDRQTAAVPCACCRCYRQKIISVVGQQFVDTIVCGLWSFRNSVEGDSLPNKSLFAIP